jgi:predicted  nucleic acid-binding Zn-ribbon protein
MPSNQSTFEAARIAALNTYQNAVAEAQERHRSAMEQARRDYDERLAKADAEHEAVKSGPDFAKAREANARLHAIRDVGPGSDLEAVRHQLSKDI